MEKKTLDAAIKEAERFIERAKACKKTAQPYDFGVWFKQKESAAVKRSSMDLTRTLADLRQGR